MFKEIMKSGLLEMEKNYGTKVDEKFHSYRREGKSSGRATATITFN